MDETLGCQTSEHLVPLYWAPLTTSRCTPNLPSASSAFSPQFNRANEDRSAELHE
uniref:Uncharacterized protein n=1 Tax=Anguilla anguilla TaxID=7936 RepID=A0A0E9W7W8_ANGAN